MRLFFFFRKLLLHKKRAQWLWLEMSPAVNSAEFLHKQMENVCSHKEVTRDPPPLFMQKAFCYAEIFCYAESFLLCRKIFWLCWKIAQKVFCHTEKFRLCRKFSVMQKNFWLSRKFFCHAKKKIMQKVFLYAEKSFRSEDVV